MQSDGSNFLGIGIYDVPDAARLTGISARRIRGWLRGYDDSRRRGTAKSSALWSPELPRIDGKMALGFLDLMEIRLVDRLIEKGLALQTVRKVLAVAQRETGSARPLSTTRFKTDGVSIFIEIGADSDDPVLLDLLQKQYAMKKVYEPLLIDLDFNDERAIRWWPTGRKKEVVVDPSRSFGRPIVNEGSVPTDVLADAVLAEGSVGIVAKYFDVSVKAVRDAIAFEDRLTREIPKAA